MTSILGADCVFGAGYVGIRRISRRSGDPHPNREAVAIAAACQEREGSQSERSECGAVPPRGGGGGARCPRSAGAFHGSEGLPERSKGGAKGAPRVGAVPPQCGGVPRA